MSHDHPIHVFINKRKFELESSVHTGASPKHVAGIPLQDVLFLLSHGDDEVIANDAKVTLKNGDDLHSQPPARRSASTRLPPYCALRGRPCAARSWNRTSQCRRRTRGRCAGRRGRSSVCSGRRRTTVSTSKSATKVPQGQAIDAQIAQCPSDRRRPAWSIVTAILGVSDRSVIRVLHEESVAFHRALRQTCGLSFGLARIDNGLIAK
jgi:hypothetical protein